MPKTIIETRKENITSREKRNQVYFYLIVIGLFLLIISPDLLSDGMFVDGLMYATISKNLANGLGSFWDLHLTNTLDPHFYAHPPLAFGLQSLFFQLFGTSILVERFYSLLSFLITGIIMTKIWKIVANKEYQQLAWLPLFIWLSIPLVFWAVSNNMLENTMMIFTSLSILFTIKSRTNKRIFNLCLSGVFIFLAFLTKGFVGLFPFALLFWIFVFEEKKQFKIFLIDLFITITSALFPFVLLYFFVPESIENLIAYFDLQVVGSISEVQTVDSRFFILGRLIAELIPIGVLALVIYFATKNTTFTKNKNKWIPIFFLLGLSGVVPIMVSLKQSGFYILASFPIFSIAIALLLSSRVNFVINKINNSKLLKVLSIILFTLAVLLNARSINTVGREKEKVADVHQITSLIPPDEVISIPPNLKTNLALHAYFARYANVSLDAKIPFRCKYLVVEKGYENELLENFKKKALDLKKYDLYESISR